MPGKVVEQRDVSHLKGKVLCSAVLETAGFAVDLKESTRRAIKFRRGNDIIIVIHDGKGWFDPLSEAKGNVLSLRGRWLSSARPSNVPVSTVPCRGPIC